jgi:predicted permease
MPSALPVLLLALACGLLTQRAARAERLRSRLWTLYYWTVTPLLVLSTFLRLHVDRALLLTLAAAAVGAWAAAGAAYAYAAVVARSREERGALALAGGFGNTGFVGIPLVQLVFGHPALALAVVYDRLAYLVPASAVTVAVARVHGRASARAGRRADARTILWNPPLWAALAAVALRLAGVHVPETAAMQSVAGAAVGPCGFFLLGLAVPLERIAHAGDEVARAAGAIAVRFAGGPLALLLAARLLHASVPHAFYFLAAMPSAFHLLVLARVYDVRPALMRLLVVGSTVYAVAAVAAVALLVH